MFFASLFKIFIYLLINTTIFLYYFTIFQNSQMDHYYILPTSPDTLIPRISNQQYYKMPI